MAEVKTDQGRTVIAWATRTIYISGEIDERVAHRVIYGVTRMTARGNYDPITLVIDSSGGLEVQGIAIYDALRACPAMIVTESYGTVQSIAAAIFMGGDKRRLAPHASVMIHDGTVEPGEVSTIELQDHLSFKIDRDAIYHRILAERSGQPLEKVEDWCREDEHWFTAEDAVKDGFCDEIIQPSRGRSKWAPKK